VLDWREGAQPWPAKPHAGYRPQRTPEERAAHRRKMTAFARSMWAETVPAQGTLVEVYLWSRLLTMAPPPTMRLHWGLRLDAAGKLPAIVAKVEHVEHGFTAVHVTWLQPDYHTRAARRGARKTFGPIGGGAVRFGEPQPDQWLVVGEGLESTLSLVLSTGRPGWAALSDRGVIGLQLPPEARQVLIAADNDAAGQTAARIAKERWTREGRRVRILTPPLPDTDWNDVLTGHAPASLCEAMEETHAA
jgi:putative DNA primase/helicase